MQRSLEDSSSCTVDGQSVHSHSAAKCVECFVTKPSSFRLIITQKFIPIVFALRAEFLAVLLSPRTLVTIPKKASLSDVGGLVNLRLLTAVSSSSSCKSVYDGCSAEYLSLEQAERSVWQCDAKLKITSTHICTCMLSQR